jgi:predicted RNase H-like HicB family nuclease
MIYPVFLERASDGWSVGVPDLLGCVSAGDTIEEALANVREAIIFHLEGMAEDGEEAPIPGNIEDHRDNPDWATADMWAVVVVPDHDLPGKAIRLNISLNERVLARIDAAVEAGGDTRSGLLARAASDYLDRRQPPIIAPARPASGRRPTQSKAARSPSKRPGRKRAPRG